jgi:hypothetical protein
MTVTLPDAYWKFDESSGNAADATGGGSTMTNNGTATFGAGALNNATTLVSASSQYFSSASSTILSPTTSFSLSFWFNLTSSPGAAEWGIFTKRNATGSGECFMVEFGAEPNGIYVLATKDGTFGAGSFDEFDSAASILPATGSFHHCVVVYDVAAGSVSAYIDNVAKTMTIRGSHNVFSLNASTNAIGIGGYGNGTAGRFVDMKFDEYGYWKNYKLTSGEVTTLYNSGTPLPYSSFSGGGGPTVKNLTALGVG